MKRVLITGAHGFVGRALCQRLRGREDLSIVATDLDGKRYDERTYLAVDLCNKMHIDTLEEWGPFDTIIHLAAILTQDVSHRSYLSIMDSNVKATLNVLGIAEEFRSRVIFPSTALVYGDHPAPFHERMPTQPEDFYSYSKLACEDMLSFFWRRHMVRSVALRTGVLYGPGQTQGFIPAVIRTLLDGRDFETHDCMGVRDYVYIDDFTKIIETLIDRSDATGTYNIGTGEAHTLREVAEFIGGSLGCEERLKFGAVPSTELKRWEYRIDASAARAVFGAEYPTGLWAGLTKTVDFEAARTAGYTRTGRAVEGVTKG